MESQENIEYRTPIQAQETGEEPQHHFDLTVEGKRIGAAEINYYSKPLPLYQVTDLYVESEYKSMGFAGKIMEQVERFLLERKKPGVLVDAIMEDDVASGCYARRGWIEVSGSGGLRVFNWPKEVPLDILVGYAARYTDHMERESLAKFHENYPQSNHSN